jgi:protein-disulfide isomerase
MRYRFAVAACALLLPLSSFAQNTQSDHLRKAIESLNETQKAILNELHDIHKLLATQQAARPAADVLPSAPIDISKEQFKGAPNAKVAVIEFSDFQCPFCGTYDKDTYPKLLKDYVDIGKIKYVWRDYPLDFHRNAQKAAEAARCASEQGRFWEMHDRLFANPQTIGATDLPKHAEALQLNASMFQQCLDSGLYAADGSLKWYKHTVFMNAMVITSIGKYKRSTAWQGPTDVGSGWQNLVAAFALLPGTPDLVR